MRLLAILFWGLLIGFLGFRLSPHHPQTAQHHHQQVERLIWAFEA